MADYTKSTGSSGTMMIRDTGSTVEFWLKAGSQTYNYQLPWAYVVNGYISPTRQFRFEPGGHWQKILSWTVTTSQTVTFKLGATGTSGLGGPTTFSVAISRTTVPGAPTIPSISSITDTSVVVKFSGTTNGGLKVTQWQIGYGTDSRYVQHYTTSTGTSTIGNLLPGTGYYFWARGYNANGWGPWSGRAYAVTTRISDTPGPVLFSNIRQTTVDITFSTGYSGGTPLLEMEVGYGLSSTGPQIYVISDGSTRIGNLSPGRSYYFWARSRNAVGWSNWNSPRKVTLVAGAHVAVQNPSTGVIERKRAVPYVNDNGVWRVGEPWSRYQGVWKRAE